MDLDSIMCVNSHWRCLENMKVKACGASFHSAVTFKHFPWSDRGKTTELSISHRKGILKNINFLFCQCNCFVVITVCFILTVVEIFVCQKVTMIHCI